MIFMRTGTTISPNNVTASIKPATGTDLLPQMRKGDAACTATQRLLHAVSGQS
jgi:hypothetical protein